MKITKKTSVVDGLGEMLKTTKSMVDLMTSPPGSREQELVFFPNGYGLSIISGPGTYCSGNTKEVAVLKGAESDYELCYDTPLTDDVLSDQTPGDIALLKKRCAEL